jgi:hypothetical protein
MSLLYKATEGLFSAMHAAKRGTSNAVRSTKSVALIGLGACVHAARDAKLDVVSGYRHANMKARHAAGIWDLSLDYPDCEQGRFEEDAQHAAFTQQFSDCSDEAQAFEDDIPF